MAQKHESIDLATLEEVERLLRSTEFASAGDLLARTDAGALRSALDQRPSVAGAPVALDSGSALAPLPRRR